MSVEIIYPEKKTHVLDRDYRGFLLDRTGAVWLSSVYGIQSFYAGFLGDIWRWDDEREGAAGVAKGWGPFKQVDAEIILKEKKENG